MPSYRFLTKRGGLCVRPFYFLTLVGRFYEKLSYICISFIYARKINDL